MAVGKLGHGKQLNNTSRESHIGGPTDAAPSIVKRIPDQTNAYVPTISLDETRLGNVAVNSKHVSHVLGSAAVMKRVNLRGTASGTAIWVDIIVLVGNNEQFDGKLLTVDDDGRGTIGQAGMNMEFAVPDTVTLTGADVGKRCIGAGNGMLKPVDKPEIIATGATDAEVITYLRSKHDWDLAKGKITRVFPKTGGGGTIQLDLWTDGAAE